MAPAFHHVELWTPDLAAVEAAWDWLFPELGWSSGHSWPGARTWAHPDTSYVVLEQSPDLADGPHDRLRAGLNHLAFPLVGDLARLDVVRAGAATNGWTELFGERYPHAGGDGHTALYLENAQGFEVEIVLVPESG